MIITDTMRLNWMAAYGASFCYSAESLLDIESGSIKPMSQTIHVRVEREDDYGYRVYDGKTMREAIDKAMIAENKGQVFPLNHPMLQADVGGAS